MATDNPVYKLFDNFLQKFVIEKKNCLFNGIEETFNIDALNDCKNLIDEAKNKYDEDGGKKNEGKKQLFGYVIDKFNDKGDETAKKFLCHIYWLWAMPASDMTPDTKNNLYGLNHSGIIVKEFRIEQALGIGNANPRSFKTREIKLLIDIVQKLWSKYKKEELILKIIKKNIIEILNNNQFEDEDLKGDLSMKNALLNLCDNQHFEPIFSNNHKESIVKAFKWMLVDENVGTIDQKLAAIREELTKNYNYNYDFSFYDDGIRELWQIDDKKVNDLDEVQLLEYKKAMVLYGPPGTSKTYSAVQLAKLLLERGMVKRIKNLQNLNERDEALEDEFKILLTNPKPKDDERTSPSEDVLNKYIDRLQLHVNYNYEDFVAGQIIKDNTVVTQTGYIFEAIKRANEHPDMPYVVILDEINRTDISRVFGEVFSAMEYRGVDIKLPFKRDLHGKDSLVLNIPDNLYFIGTMNEIDFSLERIDFALRRRFVWVLKTFDPSRLRAILLEKDSTKGELDSIDKYCSQCGALNKIIQDSPDLGENYLIGHAFFAEISNIVDKIEGKDKWEKAKKVLWQISICPIIEAYCGSMDKIRRKDILNKCENVFIEKKEQNGNGNDNLEESGDA